MNTPLALYIAFVILLVTSWVVNINKLTDCDFEAPYKCEVIHGVGVIPAVSLITAWVEVGK